MSGKTKSRSPLTKDRVLKAALRLAEKGGIESLSMRKLGQELGVEAMSLYNHVANKDDLLNGITDLALRELQRRQQGRALLGITLPFGRDLLAGGLGQHGSTGRPRP